jgi:hypothetical protein
MEVAWRGQNLPLQRICSMPVQIYEIITVK